MRKSFLLLLLLASCCLSFATYARPAGMASRILQLVNDYRDDKGREPLRMSSQLNAIAQQHSENMAARRVAFGHGGFDTRMNKALRSTKGYGFAENVAYGDLNAREVVNLWINSKGHRKNMLGNYQLTGIGVAQGRSGQLYFTQVFVSVR